LIDSLKLNAVFKNLSMTIIVDRLDTGYRIRSFRVRRAHNVTSLYKKEVK